MSNKYAHLAPSNTSKKKAIFSAVRGAAKGCLHKTPFDTEAKANTRAAEITATGVPMRSYHCPHCHAWHLARRKDTPPMTTAAT
jgi:hypothetical protein